VLKVAVKLPAAAGRIGDYLADVTALEAAGADSIWLDAWTQTSIEASTEAWIHLGAIAAVTHRVRLGVTLGSIAGWPAAVDVLGLMSSGRVVVCTPLGPETKALFQQLRTRRSASPSPKILIICETPGDAQRSAALADGVIVPGGDEEVRALRAARAQDGEFELWVDASVPPDRAGWAHMIAELDAAGATGIIVAWDPRLIDLLRSAGEPDDRSDLLIATG
jgi:alkanesulfonate monooxygenase SsuD/methylene tetrahydromethanopterin reductase-like flavin-dependent oxidoreductase (luciferase family)